MLVLNSTVENTTWERSEVFCLTTYFYLLQNLGMDKVYSDTLSTIMKHKYKI